MSIDISPIWKEPLRAECEAFLDATRTGTPPLTSGEEGLRVLKILELSQHSIEQKENIFPPALKTSNVKHNTSFFAHETAVIDDDVEIGEKTKIWHFSHILSGSKIGENCNIGHQYHDVKRELTFRYDNARHKPELGSKDHKHLYDSTMVQYSMPDISDVVDRELCCI